MNWLVAQSSKIDPNQIGLNNPTKDPNELVAGILTTVYVWAGIVAVLVIIIAGIFYATSGGNAQHTKRAREAIIYSVVGLIVIMMAFVITQWILGRF
jgi:heme O synthase-like polyprenyltransferase